MSRTLGCIAVLTSGVLAAGCAHNYPPPRELVEARAAYARVSSGPAAQLSPARLKLAKQALDGAEMAYGGAPEPEVRDRAYIAMRRAEAAEAEAGAIAASRRRERALHELAALGGVYADQARAELAAAEQRASAAGLRADQAAAAANEQQARANAESQRANQASMSLEVERQARLEAEQQARRAVTELERVATVKREARGLVITLSGQVLFVTDQATLLPAARASLDNVAAALKGMKPDRGKAVIEGHTDSTGSRGYNVQLSQRRAQAVRDYLVSQGVSAEALMVQGLGPDRPVADNRSPEGRANNRRVEIVIPTRAALAQEETTASGTSGTTTTRTVETTTTRTGGATTATSPVTQPAPQPVTTTGTGAATSTSPVVPPATTVPPPAPANTSPPAPGATAPPSPGNTTPPSPATGVPPSPGTSTPPSGPPSPPPSPR
jgi:outer membrane protein OmpA-like peptidoglycan-associated protein